MSSTNSGVVEGIRVMTVCNACRYCEGFCAVFPAMERRRVFSVEDIRYLANLCHNCRDCYYACQYAPPHEFALNVPQTLAALRMQSYQDATWPEAFKGLFKHNGLSVALICAASILSVLLPVITFGEPGAFFATHTGPGAFYRIIPYGVMVSLFSGLGLFILLGLGKRFLALWRTFGASPDELTGWREHLRAVWDVLRLKYLDGGGQGCNYPDERFSMARRYYHHAVFYGFLLCLVSTALAAAYDHILKAAAPYPLTSWPVLLGTVGGAAMVAGTAGLLFFKQKADPIPADSRSLGGDLGFLLLLLFTNLTGLLLLFLRQTPLMGLLLCLHLGFVLGLFITMPYGKFVHGLHRYAALVRNAAEQVKSKK